MKFVTKEEFDKAVAILELAVENGQVQTGHYENPEQIVHVWFGGSFPYDPAFDPSTVSFVSPARAAENRLLVVRKKLAEFKESYSIKTKELEVLEKEADAIAKVLALLKVK